MNNLDNKVLLSEFDILNTDAEIKITKDAVYIILYPKYRSTYVVGKGENRFKDISHALNVGLHDFINWHKNKIQ